MPAVELKERKRLAKEWQDKYMPEKEVELLFKSSMVDDFNSELNKLSGAVKSCDGSALEHASESAAVALAAYYEEDISGDQLMRMRRQVESLNNEFAQKCECITKCHERTEKMSMKEFLSKCVAQGGDWSAMLMSGIRTLAKEDCAFKKIYSGMSSGREYEFHEILELIEPQVILRDESKAELKRIRELQKKGLY